MEIGVKSPDGSEYKSLPKEISLYIQLGEDFDRDAISSSFIGNSRDEPLPVSCQKINCPVGSDQFLKVDMNHLGEPLMIDQNDMLTGSTFSSQSALVLCLGIIIIIGIPLILIIKNRKKNKAF